MTPRRHGEHGDARRFSPCASVPSVSPWFAFVLLGTVLFAYGRAYADAGVLIPSNRPQPDPSILSLDEMAIDILIDSGDARVQVRQIFGSHTGEVLEGNYIFALGGRTSVSDFAVWDGVTRIPGVILERRRAGEIYNDLKWQAIDPGLLQMGERGADEARRTAVFTARIVPIPAFGTKRVEIEYHEVIPVEDLKSFFAVPLRPDAYRAQAAGRLEITLELRSAHALRDFEPVSKLYPIQIAERAPHRIRATYEGRNVSLAEDFAIRYSLDPARSDSLEILAYRDPSSGTPLPTEVSPAPVRPEPGFFQAAALLSPAEADASAKSEPRVLIALFDTSLSMQWEKLERSYQALETLLRTLHPSDQFNVLLFNTEVAPFSPAPVAAEPQNVEKALAFVRSGPLRGGTDLKSALAAGLAQRSNGESYLVLLGDGGATRGTIHNGRLAAWYAQKWQELAEASRPRTYVFAVGDDANMPLLKMLARNDGLLEWVRSTEPIEFKLNAFIAKIGRRPLQNMRLTAAPDTNFDLIYPLEDSWFSGSMASWIGQYKQPAAQAVFTARGLRGGRSVDLQATAALPERSLEHPHLPRAWARARVDALLEKIERDGEDRATIDEIVGLARKYKFVTPYTSFLAAPRALLRPRVIRPGDPLLRVKTDESIVSVVALFPFGLIKKLRYLKGEDIWQTRFLAPLEMADGTYSVRLILRDRMGRAYRESKTFVIASKPPVVRVKLDRDRYHRGDIVRLRAGASESTRRILGRMYGVAPFQLRWNPGAGSNTGEFVIPAHLPAGKYNLTVTAEDIAHNIGSREVAIEVLP